MWMICGDIRTWRCCVPSGDHTVIVRRSFSDHLEDRRVIVGLGGGNTEKCFIVLAGKRGFMENYYTDKIVG